MFEKLISLEHKREIEERDLIIDEQCGFRTGHTTEHQLIRVTNEIVMNGNMNKTTTMLTLDLEKAFDLVWIDGLIQKLIKADIPTGLVKMIKSYLTERTFRVKVHGTLSEEKNIEAGVPQGGILSSILFLCYINDIPRIYPNTKIRSDSWIK